MLERQRRALEPGCSPALPRSISKSWPQFRLGRVYERGRSTHVTVASETRALTQRRFPDGHVQYMATEQLMGTNVRDEFRDGVRVPHNGAGFRTFWSLV